MRINLKTLWSKFKALTKLPITLAELTFRPIGASTWDSDGFYFMLGLCCHYFKMNMTCIWHGKRPKQLLRLNVDFSLIDHEENIFCFFLGFPLHFSFICKDFFSQHMLYTYIIWHS